MITGTTTAPNPSRIAPKPPASTAARGTNQMGKDEFLKLLITQLQNQDPMEPLNDREFISQMAQFSALEQMTNVASGLTELTKRQDAASAYALLGKTVTAGDKPETAVTGVVTEVRIEAGIAQVVVGGKPYAASTIRQVRP